MVQDLDILVFTLGLTETWISRVDGAAYPLCPGVAGGVFDDSRHAFVNLSVSDVIADMTESIELVRSFNPDARVILTVSPVPLIATMEDRSVLVSTTYSKAVLRVAAEEVAHRFDGVAYFPSYEVITGNYARGAYYHEDLREVTELGVSHVMRLFMKHYAASARSAPVQPAPTPAEAEAEARQQRAERAARKLEEVAAVICDEVALDLLPTEKVPAAEHAANAHTTPVAVQPATTALDYLRAVSDGPYTPSAGAPPLSRPVRRRFFSWLWRRG
jgi:hypothetical protein